MTATLPDHITIMPRGPFEATLRPPGSKSLTNRALLLAALAEGESTIRRPLQADDTRRMLVALPQLGFTLDAGGDAVRIVGRGGEVPAEKAALFLGNAGTAMRPLTAACCLGRGRYILDGVARMRERPIGELVAPLNAVGGDVRFLGSDGFPPLEVHGQGLEGGEIDMRPTLSSQFISALAMVAPCTQRGLTIRFHGPITSKPYVDLTLNLMRRFGVAGRWSERDRVLRIDRGTYRPLDYTVEPDASNATYFLAAAALLPGSSCTVEGLGDDSLQGDVAFVDVLAEMGASVTRTAAGITVASDCGSRLRGIDIDGGPITDAAMTLATIAVYAEGPTTIRNIGNWRVKETDRLEAMRVELTKLGARVCIDGDELTIEPPPGNKPRHAAIDTYDDHRMAMAFAILGLHPGGEGVTINDPKCVDKTFPDFFDYLDRLRP